MSAPRQGDAFALHPDQYGHPFGRTFGADIEADLIGEGDIDPTEDHLDRLWEEEQQIRGLAEKHVHPGCGHECESGACHFFGTTKAWNCDPCLRRIEDSRTRWHARAASA